MTLRLPIIASTLLLAACDQVSQLPVKYPSQQQEESNTTAIQDNADKAVITAKDKPGLPNDDVQLILAFKDGVEKDAADVAKLLCGKLGRDDCSATKNYSGNVILSIPRTGNENATDIISSAERVFGGDLKYVEAQRNFQAIRKGAPTPQ